VAVTYSSIEQARMAFGELNGFIEQQANKTVVSKLSGI
jgi:hypothetical protein